jgi:D-methionine transport system substrate-binding protein
LFSKKIKTFDEVPQGGTVAIANDPVNGARGLQLLAKANLITLKPGAGDGATILDVASNPKRLRFIELEAAQLPRALDDVVLAQVSYSYLMLAGGTASSALISDGFGDPHYALQFVTRTDRKDAAEIRKFVALFLSAEVKAHINQKYGEVFVTLW